MERQVVDTAIKGKSGTLGAFIEILAIFLKQDFSFPGLEIFTFLFAIGTLLEYSFTQGSNTTYIAFSYFGSGGTISIPVLVLMILTWKNLSFGIGGDFEKGVMQTFLVYPLSRPSLLLARLLSAIGIPMILISATQIVALLIMTPGFATQQAFVLILSYLSILALPLLITIVVLLVCMFAKNSGTPLITGIVFYFAAGILFEVIVSAIAVPSKNLALLSFIYLLNPTMAFQSYYNYYFNAGSFNFGVQGNPTWGIPSFEFTVGYLVANFVIIGILLAFCFIQFTKRVEV